MKNSWYIFYTAFFLFFSSYFRIVCHTHFLLLYVNHFHCISSPTHPCLLFLFSIIYLIHFPPITLSLPLASPPPSFTLQSFVRSSCSASYPLQILLIISYNSHLLFLSYLTFVFSSVPRPLWCSSSNTSLPSSLCLTSSYFL